MDDQPPARRLRPQRRWLLLPVIVVVVASATWATKRITAAPAPSGGSASTSQVVLSEQDLRRLLSQPPAPLTFTGFDEETESNGGAWPPSCRGSDKDGREINLFSGKLTGPSFAPAYRDGNLGVSLLVQRVPPDSIAKVTQLLADPAQCSPKEYDPKNFDPAIPQTQTWETEFPADFGDAARLVRSVNFNPGDSNPLATLGHAQVIAISGAWIVSAVSELWRSTPSADQSGEDLLEETPDRRDPDAVHAALALPELIRIVLKPFDAALGTTFATPPDAARPCTAEALGEGDLRNATGPAMMLAVLVHDAACRNDAGWLEYYRAQNYFVDGELRTGIDAHNTDGKHVPDLPALAEAIEAGPMQSAGKRLVYAASGWTFALEPRFTGLAGYLGHSTRCATAQVGSDAICEGARNRGVVGLDWEPPGMAEGCDGQPVDIKQRLYLTHRSTSVPDLVIRATCRPISTGNRPYDVTVLSGPRSIGDRAEILSRLVTEENGYIVGPLEIEGRTLYVPVDGRLAGENRWERVTIGVEWSGSTYEVISQQSG
ncbi:hypothetical protein JIG36_51175 [Actinoplanes sp. LDG1-06]|uniref:Uncharacterized protein n=1 Tax=Paractinoplanes ovalisporus TaxID=2810368 RepID=A0ABS2AVM3_9ACTN|nr:hypothetical protein [Actinoplanes ovalisporus]MBM2623881.1 hypothetical protein [Actinoplanes ovalisporus]